MTSRLRVWAVQGIVAGLLLGACASGTATTTSELGSTNEPERGERVVGATSVPASDPAPSVEPTPTLLPALPTRCTPAPPNQQQLALLPPWQPGTTFNLTVTQRRFVDERPRAGSAETQVRLTVDRLDPDGSIAFTWQPEEDSLGGVALDAIARARIRQAVGEIPDLSIRYRLDPNRIVDASADIDNLRTSLVETMAIVSIIEGGSESQTAEVRSVFDALPDDVVANLATEDAQTFHSLEGVLVTVDEATVTESPMPNLLDGAPIPTRITTEVTELADDEGCMRVETIIEPDQAAFAEFVNDNATELFGAEADGVAADVRVVERVTARYDPGTGFFVEVTYEQELSTPDESRVDVTTITVDPSG